MSLISEEIVVNSTQELQGHFFASAEKNMPVVILVHGLPDSRSALGTFISTYLLLSERLTNDVSVNTLFVPFSGLNKTNSDFTIKNWVKDLSATIDYAHNRFPDSPILIVGFSLGGAIALKVAQDNILVKACAVFGMTHSVDELLSPINLFVEALEKNGLGKPAPKEEFLGVIDVEKLLAAWPEKKPLLVGIGEDDEVVGLKNVQKVAKFVPSTQSLILYPFANHRLRYDPRVIASLVGWLGRMPVGESL